MTPLLFSPFKTVKHVFPNQLQHTITSLLHTTPIYSPQNSPTILQARCHNVDSPPETNEFHGPLTSHVGGTPLSSKGLWAVWESPWRQQQQSLRSWAAKQFSDLAPQPHEEGGLLLLTLRKCKAGLLRLSGVWEVSPTGWKQRSQLEALQRLSPACPASPTSVLLAHPRDLNSKKSVTVCA